MATALIARGGGPDRRDAPLSAAPRRLAAVRSALACCAVMPPRVRLLLASALMLFIELSLIRWLGANIVHLAYFSNFVLLGSFLGVGLGFLRAAAPDRPTAPQPLYSLVVLLGLIGFVSAVPGDGRSRVDAGRDLLHQPR